MSFVTQTPTNPAIATATPDVTAGLASGFRAKINGAKNTLDTKAESVQAFVEQLTAQFGNGAVSGGAISAGTGLSVNVALLAAIVGNIVAFDASQVVGGLTASTTNTLFLRQDGTWTVNTTGTPPSTTDGHGQALLWGTATTSGTAVTAVSNVRRTFEAGRSHVLITAADPTNSLPGDLWYNSTGNQLCVNVAGTVLRSSTFS